MKQIMVICMVMLLRWVRSTELGDTPSPCQDYSDLCDHIRKVFDCLAMIPDDAEVPEKREMRVRACTWCCCIAGCTAFNHCLGITGAELILLKYCGVHCPMISKILDGAYSGGLQAALWAKSRPTETLPCPAGQCVGKCQQCMDFCVNDLCVNQWGLRPEPRPLTQHME